VPREVSEVSSGGQFSRSSNEGQLADSQTRSYKIIKSTIDEIVDIQGACEVRIGDQHPYNTDLYCVSFDARFEGDSRLVIAVSFNYQTTPSAGSSGGGSDPKSQSPDVRPPNWTTSNTLVETPLYTWSRRTGEESWALEEPATNAIGDIYDGISSLTAAVSISVSAFEPDDPTKHNLLAGCVNKTQLSIGSLTMKAHTLMFRGVSSQPVVESWGGNIFRGWRATYEFIFKRNPTKVHIGGSDMLVDLGWDVAVPESGFNVRAFAPPGGATQDPYGQPLKFDDDGVIADPLALPDGLAAGDKARAMVRVPFNAKASQAPSASPIPLNDDGTPRSADADPKVLVYGYAVQPEADFKAEFPRLQFP
jgi:hypothetical protein